MKDMTPQVSIVVRAYNEGRYIEQLLYGIKEQDFPDYEVILVDSGSEDSTVAIAESYGARVVHIEKERFSFGRSLNMGCESARGAIIVIASGHVYPLNKNWLRLLIEPLKTENVAVSYGRQSGDSRSKFSEHILFRHWFPERSSAPQPSYFCNNANCAIKKVDWQINRYDERLTGLEDLNYAKYFFDCGREIHYVSDAVVAHVHEESWHRIRNRYMREAIAMKRIDPSMDFSIPKFITLLLRHIFGDLLEARRHKVLALKFREILLFRFNQLLGTYMGYQRSQGVTEEMRKRFYYPTKSEFLRTETNSESQIHYPEKWHHQAGDR